MFCSLFTDQDKDLMEAKWVSLVEHVQNRHSGESFTHERFARCAHDDDIQERLWIQPGTDQCHLV